jgi:hypothetical protein
LYLHIPASALAIASEVSHLTIPGAGQSNTVKGCLIEGRKSGIPGPSLHQMILYLSPICFVKMAAIPRASLQRSLYDIRYRE